MIRYYGALAPNSPLRPSLVADASSSAGKARLRRKAEDCGQAVSARARSWAACLARVFEVDPLVCSRCGQAMVPVAVIMADAELVRLLTHLGLPTDLPKTKPATIVLARGPEPDEDLRAPPDDACQLDPRADLYGEMSPPADDFSAA